MSEPMTSEQLKDFLSGKVVTTPIVPEIKMEVVQNEVIKPVIPLEIAKAPKEEPNVDYSIPTDTKRLDAMAKIRKQHGGLVSDIPVTSNYYALRNRRRK